MKLESIIAELRKDGVRITQMRRHLLNLFLKATTPLSVLSINEILEAENVHVNKTTIYRELEFLLERKLITSIQFNEDKKRYELIRDHHHHLVCDQCGNIEEVKIKALEDLFGEIETQLRDLKKFKLVNHSLEFFGVCKECEQPES